MEMTDKDLQAVLKEAAAVLDVAEQDLMPFAEEDPFNPGNRLEGAVSRQGDHRYGAIFLRRVRTSSAAS
jgi:hypothetical protein